MRPRIFWIVVVMLFLGSVSPATRAADMNPIFGPQQFTRTTSAPQTFGAPFSHCGTAPCQIVVINGNADGSNRTSSASISLNGTQVVGPADFNQQVGTIVKPVTLAPENELMVRLASKPGGFITVEIECLASHVVLSAVAPGASLQDSSNLLSAFRIENTGTAPAENVHVTFLTLAGATLTTPPTLPLNLGTIPAGSSAVVNADFSGAFSPGASYPLSVLGTYSVGSASYCFNLTVDLVLPPAAPGSASLGTVSVPPLQVTGGGFPHLPVNFGEEVNTQRWTVPTASLLPAVQTPTSTAVEAAPIGDPPSITFLANNSLGLTSGSSNGTTISIAEPSGAATAAGVIFATANLDAAYSINGTAFTQLDPTTIFPNDAVGYCCDQIVQYVPSIDRFVWLLQGNGYRLAVASPADLVSSGGTAWTYWNLTPSVFGQPAGVSFDYPDLSVGDHDLYISWDTGGPRGCDCGHQVVRTSLAGLAAGGTIEIDYTDPANGGSSWGAKLVQDTGNEIFWAGQNDNRHMRIFSLMEGSNSYYWQDIGISSWANNSPLSSLTPDGKNWVNFLFNPTTQNPGGGFPNNAVIGGTRSGDHVWLAWSAGTDNNFHQPHVEMLDLGINGSQPPSLTVNQQVQIWNNNYAFAYPALATNSCTGEIGLSLEYGGNGHYENHVVGIWGDFVVYITSESNVGTTRFGDYVTIRQQPPTEENPGNLFDAFGYGLNSVPPPGSGTASDLRYVLFGRPASSCEVIQ